MELIKVWSFETKLIMKFRAKAKATNFKEIFVIILVTPKAAAKNELMFHKLRLLC